MTPNHSLLIFIGAALTFFTPPPSAAGASTTPPASVKALVAPITKKQFAICLPSSGAAAPRAAFFGSKPFYFLAAPPFDVVLSAFSRRKLLPSPLFNSIRKIALNTIPSTSKIEIRCVLDSHYGFDVAEVTLSSPTKRKKTKCGPFLAAKLDYRKGYVTLRFPLSLISSPSSRERTAAASTRICSTSVAVRSLVDIAASVLLQSATRGRWKQSNGDRSMRGKKG
ncbi:hypothetical protein Cni_G25256 [Canna indica]|uniref:Uncharacterized protein n=1 Tax=Canna indica TaxID=4628 RepID=A0AAQ3QM79_9LILI|nr:hypothetical protein Cni_G25256 [Canna indica]